MTQEYSQKHLDFFGLSLNKLYEAIFKRKLQQPEYIKIHSP